MSTCQHLKMVSKNTTFLYILYIYIYTVHVVSLSSPCIPMLKLTETLVLLLKGEGIAAAWRILIDILSWCMYLWEALGANLGGR